MTRIETVVTGQNFPNLCRFVGSFHEDWQDDVRSPAEAFEGIPRHGVLSRRLVEKFLQEALPEEITKTVAELEKVLQLPHSDSELAHVMQWQLHCYYSPEEQQGYRQWLRAVRDQLSSSANIFAYSNSSRSPSAAAE